MIAPAGTTQRAPDPRSVHRFNSCGERVTLKAIETRYAGCRFRSRLEARWAVFFDHAEIPWQYEPQGFIVGPDRVPYLPDFYLPDDDLWVEVKGDLPLDERRKLWQAVANPETGLPSKTAQPSLLLLGNLPHIKKESIVWYQCLRYMPETRRESLFFDLARGAYTVPAGVYSQIAEPRHRHINLNFPQGIHINEWDESAGSAWRLDPFVDEAGAGDNHLGWGVNATIANAYAAARGARFEFGEQG